MQQPAREPRVAEILRIAALLQNDGMQAQFGGAVGHRQSGKPAADNDDILRHLD